VRVISEPHDWRGALRAVGALLYDLGFAEKEYAQDMVEAVENLGPYICIAPGLAIAHAAPGNHVIRDGMVLCVFRHPVFFGSENDPVRMMIGLCAKTPGRHLDQFTDISACAMEEEVIARISGFADEEELYIYLQQLKEGGN